MSGKFRTAALAGLFLCTTAFVPVSAQSLSDDTTTALVNDLKKLIEKGEQERSADPWFLQDLRDLIEPYDNPWQVLALQAEFDADGAPPAPWTVTAGEMRVDWRFGLRSVVRAPTTLTQAPPAEPEKETQTHSQEEAGAKLLGAILGTVLQQAQRNQGSSQTASAAQPSEPADDASQPATIEAAKAITNGFKANFELSLRALGDGTGPGVEIGVYQVSNAARPGYRLAFDAAENSVTLLRLNSRGGRALIDSVAAPTGFFDGNVKRLEWRRHSDGRTSLSIDGAQLFETTDRGFRDPWAGWTMTNFGGDIVLRRITVFGTE